MTRIRTIIGPPGTGKTTTLAERVHESVQSGGHAKCAMVASYTVAGAAEAAGRDTGLDRAMIGTIHSHAFRALRLERGKLVDKLLEEFNASQMDYELTADPRPGPEETYGDQCRESYEFARNAMIPRDQWSEDTEEFAAAFEDFKRDTDTYDFTDMLERAIRYCPIAPHSPAEIFLDEAQDSTRLQLKLVHNWGKNTEVLTIVGDPDQCMYEYAGAYPAMFFDERAMKDREILSKSYRVPREVHARALAWRAHMDCEQIQYAPRDGDHGSVEEIGSTWNAPDGLLEILEQEEAAGRTVMIMAAANKLLWPTIRMLRREGIPFHNPWRKKDLAWNPLSTKFVNQLLAFVKFPGAWSANDLSSWTPATKGVLQRGAKSEIHRLLSHEMGRTLQPAELARILQPGWSTSVDWLESVLNSAELKKKSTGYILDVYRERDQEGLTERPTVSVGTMHSFKGTEADTVIIFPELVYPQHLAWTWSGKHPFLEPQALRDSIVRMGYVALTRARHKVIIGGVVRWGMPL